MKARSCTMEGENRGLRLFAFMGFTHGMKGGFFPFKWLFLVSVSKLHF
jgi:hypothetical protein